MDRRDFVKTGALYLLSAGLPLELLAQSTSEDERNAQGIAAALDNFDTEVLPHLPEEVKRGFGFFRSERPYENEPSQYEFEALEHPDRINRLIYVPRQEITTSQGFPLRFSRELSLDTQFLNRTSADPVERIRLFDTDINGRINEIFMQTYEVDGMFIVRDSTAHCATNCRKLDSGGWIPVKVREGIVPIFQRDYSTALRELFPVIKNRVEEVARQYQSR